MAKKPDPEAAAKAAAEHEAQRKRSQMVETLAGYGLDHETIGGLLDPPISAEQLQADYARELERGPALADLETVTQLRAAVKKGQLTAIIWWTKARMGWTEKGPGERDNNAPPASETAAPTQMPTASQLSEKILRFPQK